jgi:predicted CXXCH cytochrome family protein
MFSVLRPLCLLASVAVLMVTVPASAQGQTGAAPANGCATCHAGLPEQRLAQPAALFSAQDIHRDSGFACVNCHGGDPGAADAAAAHAVDRGFKGAPNGQAQIAACASCHSDAELMHRFSPRQRVDQAVEYASSVHGKRLAGGDTKVATCASCHGAHGIRLVNDAKSPVFPTNVAATCASCHADPAHMSGYTKSDGSPVPTTQRAEYEKSVHHTALTAGNDLSAPTCNDCHGNHGAAPPGVGNVANACGTCHAVFAERFDASVHAQIFDRGCVECHSNHAILKPSDDMLGTSPQALCAACHEGPDDKGAAAADAMRAAIERLKTGIDRSGSVIGRIGNEGIEVSASELALAEARTKLTLARTEIHAADVARVEAVITEGDAIVAGVDRAGEEGAAELRFRRRGLFISLGAILLVIVAIALKLRQIDRGQAAS